ncbi:26S proteasome regulatory complex, subunit RPN8/PSMD7 [Pseudoloma neurophilia]|uniref:26S proteasome regulatory complex, subunit RPN8/PSMD7 n=1 Tax=Pseudoloma neurophilia TaxID=146866 RepID=A0A0R0M161_9MICR|nr:26S proteasome regulatory complex, subunit RPN8/PSMD7 [Pseudoloma neurophilia]
MAILTKSGSSKKLEITPENAQVIVHPLVLLAVVDHFHRTNGERAIGLLLGHIEQRKVLSSTGNKFERVIIHATNSFALPFDNNPEWHIDTQYIQEAIRLNDKVTKNEYVVGWYHTGPELFSNDIEITQFFQTYNINSLLAIIDVKAEKMPVSVFKLSNNEFENLKTVIEAEEAEEVGVEHLLREVRDITLEKGYSKMTNDSNEDENEGQSKAAALPFFAMTGHDVLAGLKVYKEKLEAVLEEINYIIDNNETPKEELLNLLLKCLKNVRITDDASETESVTSKLSIDSTKKDTITSKQCSDGTDLVSAIAKTYILGEDLVSNRKEY